MLLVTLSSDFRKMSLNWMESCAFVSSCELIQQSATAGMAGLNFHSAILLMLTLEVVIRITDPTYNIAESL